MSTKLIASTVTERDGTSQTGRASAALSPEYVSVDERTPEDILKFVREYAKTVVYYGEDNRPHGDLSAFFDSLTTSEMAAFLQNPEAFNPDLTPALYRPHLTLFFAFLRLLDDARVELNTLTRRHLDFYYRRFLRLQAQKAIPDRVNVLFSTGAGEDRVFVPKGTAVTAGSDSTGKERVYRTGRDLVVGQARLEKISSLYVEREVIGIQKSWHDHRNDPEGGRFEMFCIAYGRPLPGDPLPDYPGTPPTRLSNDDELDAKLTALQSLVKFCSTGLSLTLTDLRALVALPVITGDLDQVITNKRARYKETIDTVAKYRNSSYQPPANATTVFNSTSNAALTTEAFHSYANAALGPLIVPGRTDVTTIAGYWKALLEIENYVGLSIENFEMLVDKLLVQGDAWDLGYERDSAFVSQLLEKASFDKIRQEAIANFALVRPGQSTAARFTALLQQTLGDEVTGIADDEDLRDRLSHFLSDADMSKLASAFDASQWDAVYGLLVQAMFVRLGNAIPQKTVWKNLYAAADARTVLANRGVADSAGKLPFSAFGAPMERNATDTPPALLGFAVTSPILALSGGTRTVTVTLGLRAEGYEFNRLMAIIADTFGKVDAQGRSLFPLRFEVSTATGWIPCSLASRSFGDYDTLLSPQNVSSVWPGHAGAPGLRFVLILPVGEVPVAPLQANLDGMDARWPALRILMQPVWSSYENRFVTYYRELSSLFVGAVHIEVSASGLLPSALENDESVVDPKKPFDVFGNSPAPRSRLLIGHPEIVSKPISRLSFAFQWFGAPTNLADHYANYGIAAASAAPNFTVQVSTVDRTGTRELVPSASLFQSDTSALTEIKITSLTPPIVADYSTLAGTGSGSRLANWKRVWQWRLGPVDFQHRAYPTVAAQKSLEFVTDSTRKPNSAYQVKPPYTPKLQSLTIDYTAAVEIVLYRATAGDKLDRVYHVHPFGVVEIAAETESEEVPFLPPYGQDSALYLGFAEVSLPENVTLVVQLDEGSADRDVTPPQVSWSQLSGNRWKPLGNKVVADATRGFQKSGIIEFSLESTEPNTLLSRELTWVRAAVGGSYAAICDLRELHTQAAEVVFDDQGNAPTHYRTALPSGTITRLKSPISGIVGLTQPYASYGGRVAEDETVFSTRVSERLRHKQRAISSWDYERMVLDAFPEIFKTKCIPSSEETQGLVEVLVIPDVRTVPTNEFGPKAPVALIGSIQQYLSARVPRCMALRVRNASYRAVRVRLGVRFSEKGNEGYWKGQLNDDLNRFLSPWAYDEGADVVVGGKIYASSIVEFVDRRAYVDYVAGISLFYTDDEGDRFTFLRPPGDGGGAYCVEAGGPDRVLVAYPQHRIDLLTSAHYDARLYRGVNYMEMELDFVVG